jgi:hypothetical protein
MSKFSVQTFYQPLFSHSFPFNNFPLAILFPSKSFPQQKAHSKSPKGKTEAKAQGKSKSPKPSFSGPFINSSKQSAAEALGEGRDIVAGETCLPASLNASLGDAAVLLFPVHDQGCAYLGLQVKAIKPHLALLVSSSHRLFIIPLHNIFLAYLFQYPMIVTWEPHFKNQEINATQPMANSMYLECWKK